MKNVNVRRWLPLNINPTPRNMLRGMKQGCLMEQWKRWTVDRVCFGTAAPPFTTEEILETAPLCLRGTIERILQDYPLHHNQDPLCLRFKHTMPGKSNKSTKRNASVLSDHTSDVDMDDKNDAPTRHGRSLRYVRGSCCSVASRILISRDGG